MNRKEKNSSSKQSVSRRDFLKITGATVGGLATGSLVGVAFPQTSSAQVPSGTINVVMSAGPDNLDAHCWLSTDGAMIGVHIFEALINRDFEPLLATSWENPDKLTWIFNLRKGVTFSNGEPFNASVVKFNIERVKNPETKATNRMTMEPVVSVDVVDTYTVKIKTNAPYTVLLAALRDISMMSPKAVAEYGKDIVRKPVGTGPFVLKEWTPMERAVLEANPSYYGTKPKVNTIIWKQIAEPTTRIVELTSGNADIVNKIPPELANGISAQGVKVVRQQSVWRMGVMLNCGKPPFNDVRVRQAINYAANKEDLVNHVLKGAGFVMSDPVGPGIGGHNPNIKPYPHDPAKAKKLLADAGYPKGVDIEILTPAGRYLKDKELVEALAFQVKDAGFNVKVIPQEWGMFLKNYRSHHGFFIAEDTLYAHRYFVKNMDSRLKSYAWFGYHNDELNKLLDEASETFDATKRDRIYQKLSQIVFDDAVFLYMYYAQDIYGVRDRVRNFTPRPDSWILLRNASVA